MSSLNKVQLIGRLGKDPEVRSFQSGSKVCNFTLATSESWKDKTSGERKEKAEWHTVAIFGDGLVSVAERYLRKGSQCYVEGQLRTRKWQDQSGGDRYSTEIVLQGPNAKLILLGDGGGSKSKPGSTTNGTRGKSGSAGGWANDEQRTNPADDLDDDIPF